MTGKTDPTDSILRRTVLKASTVAAGAFTLSGSATAIDEHEDKNDDGADKPDDEPEDKPEDEEPEVDEPDGFEAEVLAEHAGFTDDVAAMFTLEFADDREETEAIEADLEDASNLVFLELNWEPGGSLGWHHHPGPVFVNVVEGEIELTWEMDCVPRTYAAGDSLLDPGEVHIAVNTSDDEPARAFGIAFGVPDEAAVTEWVEPVDC